MSLLPYLSSVTCTDRDNNTAKVINAITTIVYFGLFALAIFLAIKDMNSLEHAASKIWLFIFALFAPELYVIIHGLSSSSLGLPFFSENAVEIPFSTRPVQPSPSPTNDFATDKMADHIKKASNNLNSDVSDLISSIGSSI